VLRRRLVAATAALLACSAGPFTALAAQGGPVRPDPGCQSQGSWPMYQADPAHTGDGCSAIDAANVSQLRPSWFFSTPGTVTDTPAVAFGTVFAGDSTGEFYALNRSDGAVEWKFDTTAPQDCFLDAADPHADRHQPSYGEITASPAVATVGGRRIVYVAAGASLFALEAGTGRCLWAQDTDPAKPTSVVEIESSPVVDTSVNPPEVLLGNDTNDSTGVAWTGFMAFDALSGSLLWKYVPIRDITLTPSEFGGSDAATTGAADAATLSCGDGAPNPYCSGIRDAAPVADDCGDTWSSPALDSTYVDPAGDNTYQGSAKTPPAGWYAKQITATGAKSRDGLVIFATANCSSQPTPAAALAHGDYVDNQGVFALDPVTGVRVWNFIEPYNQYDNNPNEPGGGDDDMGSSPLLADVPSVKGCPTGRLVIEGSKSGYAYGLCETTGAEVWLDQVAQPGQVSPDSVGSIGGIIGSPSLGLAGGKPTVFFTSAEPLPFSNDGVRTPGDGDTNISSCPGLSPLPLLPACPDGTVLSDPQRLTSLHAVDALTGRVDYDVPSMPTYAASTYTGGVVFLPDSFAAGVAAFDADTGQPLWAFPLAAIPASGAAIAGSSVYLGTGEADGSTDGLLLPPQATGIWSFSLPVG
jgi:outer membrane protein assembly factor BamB